MAMDCFKKIEKAHKISRFGPFFDLLLQMLNSLERLHN